MAQRSVSLSLSGIGGAACGIGRGRFEKSIGETPLMVSEKTYLPSPRSFRN